VPLCGFAKEEEAFHCAVINAIDVTYVGRLWFDVSMSARQGALLNLYRFQPPETLLRSLVCMHHSGDIRYGTSLIESNKRVGQHMFWL
jgi:hypothetical protein